jgi:hypothetical protein
MKESESEVLCTDCTALQQTYWKLEALCAISGYRSGVAETTTLAGRHAVFVGNKLLVLKCLNPSRWDRQAVPKRR